MHARRKLNLCLCVMYVMYVCCDESESFIIIDCNGRLYGSVVLYEYGPQRPPVSMIRKEIGNDEL